MGHLLKPGQSVKAETSGLDCQIEQFLGGGGQGEVYQARLAGNPVALKWYFPASATTQQRQGIQLLVHKGAPNKKFLWPIELVSSHGTPGFGYIMPLRTPEYHGIIDLMKRRIEPSFHILAMAGLELAHNYLQLHAMGYCYQDISFGNVFFNPDTGEVLICDNDNVTIDGQTRSGVLGTPRFMAPEIVRGEAYPSIQTDLFSLAVLLFYIFMVHHPLEGRQELDIKCLDLPAMCKLYGTHPLFVFDPGDDANEPVAGYHDNALAFWPLYPQFLKELFTKAFTQGLRSPHQRIRESEWRSALASLRDAILYCPACAAENFYDARTLKASGGTPPVCWACSQPTRLPPRIRIESQVIMLNHDTKLFSHHLDPEQLYNFSEIQAKVTQHPQHPDWWGLRNLSGYPWNVSPPEGPILEVQPGQSVPLAVGTRIDFGQRLGEIRL